MNDERKTKKQLIAELETLRQQVGTDESGINLERAVERIRAAVASMRSRDDLVPVVALVRREMVRLGIDTFMVGIGFINEETRLWRWYNVIDGFRGYGMRPADPLPANVRVVSEDHVSISDWMEDADKMPVWQSGEPHTYERTRHVRTNYAEQWGFHELTEQFSAWLGDRDTQYNTDVPFEHGIVAFAVLEPQEEHGAIVRALTEALSLGYLRYLDFQQLEQQAEQARRETAVERVRAEAMAMRKSDDLLKVVGALIP